MQAETPIPHFYLSLAKGNRKLFIRYVEGYVIKSHPGYKLKTIKQMTAIIEKDNLN